MFNTKNKIALAAAITLASVSASAQVDLNPATGAIVPYYVAQEVTLVTGSDGTEVVTPDASNGLDISSNLGFGFRNDQNLIVRYDLDNGAEFVTREAAPSLNELGTRTGRGTYDGVALSATEDESTLMYYFTLNANGAPTNKINLPINSINIKNKNPVNVTVRIYDGGAIIAASQGGPAIATSSGPYVNFRNSSTVAFTAAATAPTAEVEEGFTVFKATDAKGKGAALGTVAHTVRAADSQPFNLAGAAIDAVATIYSAESNLVIEGDFSAAANEDGTYTGDALSRVHLQADCTEVGTPATTVTATSATFTPALNIETAATSVCFDPNGTTALNESTYTATFNGVGATTGTGTAAVTYTAPEATVGPLASIVRNGTTIQIPVLTTYEGYNQRFFLVNRGTADVAYSFTFTPENGVTATPGTAASGTLTAGETTALRATEIVALSGQTRTAATLNIVSAAATIDVATQTVDLSDGVTDTVVLD